MTSEANDENHNENIAETAGNDGGQESNKESSGAPGWFISVAVHSLFGLIFYCAVWATVQPEIERPPYIPHSIDPPVKIVEKKPLDRSLDPMVEVKITAEAEVAAPISPLDVVKEEKSQSEDNTEATVAKGREEAVASAEVGQTGAFMAIGPGSNAAGPFGSRTGGGKGRALREGGGSRASESSVDAALRWFKRHQSPNGMWDVEKYTNNCTDNPKCEPGSNGHGGNANVAVTGYAVLCYLGAGYDHRVLGTYKATVAKGLDYLRSVQAADGLLGERNYEHAVATMCLAEAYAMTNDPELKGPAQKAINIILARQNKDAKAADAAYSGLGWDYIGPNNRNDSSVTGWNVMALKSGLAGGLNVGNGMEGSKKWLKGAWEAGNPDFKKLSDPYKDESGFPYTWDATTNTAEKDHLAPVGALCAVFLGHHAGDTMLETMCNRIMNKQFPTTYPTNTYFMYYNTLAIFQAGGERWLKWNGTVRDLLVNAQRKDEGCFNGSWDFEGTQFPGHEVGRVLSTAYCCLSLEVYYRYKRAGGK